MSYRYMRSLLFFDLPTVTNKERQNYRHFVKEIKKLGFYMLQESVYVKMSIDSQMSHSVVQKVKALSPSKGSIMILNITEKQFSQLSIIVGENPTDVVDSDERLIIL